MLIALRAILRIAAPHEDMSNYENKQIPQKTDLASYLVSKSHGSEIRNCRDQRVLFPARHNRDFAAQLSPQTTGKKNPLAPRILRNTTNLI